MSVNIDVTVASPVQINAEIVATPPIIASTGTVVNHNLHPGLQGGQAAQYYHLTLEEHNNISNIGLHNSSSDLQGGQSEQYYHLTLEEHTNKISGSGTVNYIPKFTGSHVLGNSLISDDGSTVNVNGKLTLNSLWFNVGNNIMMNSHDPSTLDVSAEDNIYMGYASGWGNFVSTNNTGYRNVGIGIASLQRIESGHHNIGIGSNALEYLVSGNANIGIGHDAGYNNISGSSNIFLGYRAGYYETGSNKLFIDNTQRASEADARTKALIYGEFASTTAAQKLYLNSNVYVSDNIIASQIPKDSHSTQTQFYLKYDGTAFTTDTDRSIYNMQVENFVNSGSLSMPHTFLVSGKFTSYQMGTGNIAYVVGLDSSAVTKGTTQQVEGIASQAQTRGGITTDSYGLLDSVYALSVGSKTPVITNAYGLDVCVSARSYYGTSANIVNAYGIRSKVGAEFTDTGTASITNAYNIKLCNYTPDPTMDGTALPVVNLYQLYIEKPTWGSSINKAIYVTGGDVEFHDGDVSADRMGIGILVPDASAILDLTSTAKGFAEPRMTTTQRTAISAPIEGLQVYDSTLHQPYYYNGSTWNGLINSTGTSGYVPKFTSATKIANSPIYIDGSDKVGIGTIAPSASLEIMGSYDKILRLSDSGLAHGMTSIVPTNVFFSMEEGVNDRGCASFRGLCGNYANMSALGFIGISGHTAPTSPVIAFWSGKKSGTSYGLLAATDPAFAFQNYTTRLMTILGSGNIGIGTTTPDKKLEINSATGDCLRLTYNDADGSATYYTDFAVSSAGNLKITPSGGVTNIQGIVEYADNAAAVTAGLAVGDLYRTDDVLKIVHA